MEGQVVVVQTEHALHRMIVNGVVHPTHAGNLADGFGGSAHLPFHKRAVRPVHSGRGKRVPAVCLGRARRRKADGTFVYGKRAVLPDGDGVVCVIHRLVVRIIHIDLYYGIDRIPCVDDGCIVGNHLQPMPCFQARIHVTPH